MWFSKLFTSSQRRKLRKKPNVALQRRLGLERLEDRRLLTVTISGTIDVSNLPCAATTFDPATHLRVAMNVPVSGALVTASYTVGGHTETSPQVWTNNQGHYQVVLNSAAVAGGTVTMTIVAQSQQQTAGLPAYSVYTAGTSVLKYEDFDETLPTPAPANGNYTDANHGHTFDYDSEQYDAASFAAFSILQADYLAATQGMGVTFTSPLIVKTVLGGGSADSHHFAGVLNTITLGLDAVANNPDVVAHEFGHYVAQTGNFLAPAGGKHFLDANLRTKGRTDPSSTLTTASLGLAFNEGWADYYAVVVPSLVNTTWLHIPQLSDSTYTLSSGTYWDAATPGGWGEDNEISVMRIFYQMSEGNQRVGTPAQLYNSLSALQTKTLSAFWNKWYTQHNPSTLSQFQAVAARAQVFIANEVGPTQTAPTVNAPGAQPAISINFSVRNLSDASTTFYNKPTFSGAEIYIYNTNTNVNAALVTPINPISFNFSDANAQGNPLTEQTPQGNAIATRSRRRHCWPWKAPLRANTGF